MSSTRRRPSLPIALALFAFAAAVFLVHAWLDRSFFVDDSFISLRYAHRLTTGHGLTWVDGERVEGYSNFLWVLGCAALMKCGLGGVIAARVLGLASGLAAIWAMVRLHSRSPLPAAYGALVLALSMTLAGYAMGGLETPAIAALLAWALVALYPLLDRTTPLGLAEAAPAGVAFALLTLTRPDGIFLFGALAAGFFIARGLSREALGLLARIAVWPLAALLGHLAFRLAYYGDPLPNTAYVKAVLGWARLAHGLRYLELGALNLLGPLLLAIAALFVAGRRRVVCLGVAALLWTAYVAVVGGDWMPAHRMLVVDVVLCAALGAELLEALIRRGGDFVPRALIAAAVVLVLFGVTQTNDADAPRFAPLWVWDGEVVGRALGRAFPTERPTLALDAVGAIAYFSEVPTLDLLGLTDRHIARTPASVGGRGIPGHEHGDGRYALDRQPDLAIFDGPSGGPPSFRSGREMVRDPRWKSWVPVTLELGSVRSSVWVRRDGRVGVRRSPGRLEVPAWLLGFARPDASGRLMLDVPAGATAELALPDGDFTVSTPKVVLASGKLRVIGPAELRGTIVLTETR